MVLVKIHLYPRRKNTLSILMAIFQVNLGQPMRIEAKATGAISHAKLQPNHHHQQTNIQFPRRKSTQ